VALVYLVALVGLACSQAETLDTVRMQHSSGNFAASIEPLRRLLDEDPENSELHFRYGTALVRIDQPGLAVWPLRRAAEDPNWMVLANLELGRAALLTQNWPVTIEAADRILEVEPENTSALFLRAEAKLKEKGDLEGALADYDRVLELESDHIPATISRGATLVELERVEEAAEAIEELAGLGRETGLDSGTLGKLCILRAVFAREREEYEAADQFLEACLESFPTHHMVIEEALNVFDASGEYQRGTSLLREAVEQIPGSLSYRVLLARRLRAVGHPEAAEETLRAALEIEGVDQANAWSAIADHFTALGDLDRAAAAHEQSLSLRPDPTPLQILWLADTLAQAGQNERALDVAKRLEDKYRGLVEARVYLNQGRPADSLARLDEILHAWPNNPASRYYAARAAEQIGGFDRAVEEYRQSIRSGAGFTDAGMRLARLLQGLGNYEAAWVAVGHHHKAHPGDGDAVAFMVELTSRRGPEARLRSALALAHGTPHWARAVAVRSEFLARRSGAAAAAEMIQASSEIDLTQPRDAAALRALVAHLIAAGRPGEAQAAVENALSKHPNSATFHEIQGFLLAARAAAPAEILSAYRRAVELDPGHARGLAGLARHTEDLDAALPLYERAAEADLNDPTPWLDAAERLSALGRADEAASRWEAVLREHPYDPVAALKLAETRLEQGQDLDPVLTLARRAARFGGPDGRRLLARVHELRGETDQAAEAIGGLGDRDSG
jgi:tetratricopeptide (TPR) repeat protein